MTIIINIVIYQYSTNNNNTSNNNLEVHVYGAGVMTTAAGIN